MAPGGWAALALALGDDKGESGSAVALLNGFVAGVFLTAGARSERSFTVIALGGVTTVCIAGRVVTDGGCGCGAL